MADGKIKSLSDYKEEIHKCSKCGLCQAVCPLYQTTGNECSVSRGLFIMLKGVISGKLKMSEKINSYLDMCLKCGKCSDYCPSEIDVVDLLMSAKNEHFKISFAGKIYSFLESKWVFNTFLKILKTLTCIFTPRKKSKKCDTKAVYFGGCISKAFPDVDNYVTTLLNMMNIEVLDVDFNCCGMAFYTTGNLERFAENLKENILEIPDGVSLLVTECASCEQMWKKYEKYIDDEKVREKYSQIKIVSIYELIDKNEIKFAAEKNRRITYHKPCHENHFDSVMNIIKNIENTEYTELNGMDECCGFGGFEHIGAIEPTSAVRKKKQSNIKNSDADTVLTTCAGCLISLALISGRKSPKRLITFLKDYCKIQK